MRTRAAALALAACSAGAEPVDYVFTPTHSFVNFEFLHRGLSTQRGRFDRCEGRLTLDRDAGHGRVEVALRPSSVSTGVGRLDQAVREALGGEAPARFEADALEFAQGRVTGGRGRLTLRGHAAPLAFRALRFDCYRSPLLEREVCGGDFVAELDASDWGVGLDAAWGFGDRVRLVVQVEAVRQ